MKMIVIWNFRQKTDFDSICFLSGLVFHFQYGSKWTFGDVTQHLEGFGTQNRGIKVLSQRGNKNKTCQWRERKNMTSLFSKSLSFVLMVSFTWKCSCPGTTLCGNSGRNMAMNAGKLHSALSLSGPTPANLNTCSGMSGVLPWSIRRWFRRKLGGARRQRVAGMDRPMLEKNPRHPDESSSSDLCGGTGKSRTLKEASETSEYFLKSPKSKVKDLTVVLQPAPSVTGTASAGMAGN